MGKYSDAYGFWSEPAQLLSLTISPPFWKTGWFIALSSVAVILITGLAVRQTQRARFLKKIEELERQNALERERGRISRDLHDELGTGLSLIMLNTSMASSTSNNELIQKHLTTISKNSKELYDNMSNLIWLLKSESQTLENLTARIREKMSEILDEAGFEYSVITPESIDSIIVSREACRHIFLLVKEAVNNAIKHSQGTKVEISINIANNSIHLNICDNGVGFNVHKFSNKGNGMGNMRLRAIQLGGNIDVDSSQGNGTKVKFVLPI
jgi:signal transduction histidine kinase